MQSISCLAKIKEDVGIFERRFYEMHSEFTITAVEILCKKASAPSIGTERPDFLRRKKRESLFRLFPNRGKTCSIGSVRRSTLNPVAPARSPL
jgi:hypothetical protein